MAVVAGGDFGSDIGFAQGHGFAVVGLAIMLEAVLVAFAATRVTGHFEVAIPGGFDLVGGVAVAADRAALVALGHELAVDALVIDALDPDVAFAAGLGDVQRIDGGVAVNGALDVMHAVAVVAGGGDDQAHLDQGTAVDAVEVLRGHVGILHLVFLGEGGVGVAGGASAWQVQLEDGILCEPWQSQQLAAPDAPIAWLRP
jgi:hypothetical protein